MAMLQIANGDGSNNVLGAGNYNSQPYKYFIRFVFYDAWNING